MAAKANVNLKVGDSFVVEEWLKVIGNIHENPELLARK